ncbi:30S ribosomal protein S4 [Candidatus Falkowbacteria bacterium]|uniref:Small ribosomal subunit protein uS4 n=1 Tax=Candidatus Falkowbacteria bacterium CG10_big_fil_rev_8_21_14_0_10_37_18 TaxID=1974562 RepID=A0A2H0V8W3_9BACT|nr:30S ribosomal protein S4 [Candidatus Falkowbacteria bacterium]NCQ12561.1 30S ribosomal protein S4 [Candidatus Falkowbacteria bacterium]OIO06023.1 MAG: 30S ribosomal protein S4 [Candidatus Falkowbacteria bacterium CG1_02_37_21]PIR95547.1 MAG: 30S ribosomal protein S4 [Candidatus Falkowbacteria bacterium CG10_big_fil_rev_8_21_14_0_10_37_18]
MGRNIDNKCKQCRRAGEKLFLKGERCFTPKCAIIKRNYAPGFHGPKGHKRLSDYGQQLAEKQKAKKFYGLAEKQFRLTFDKAVKKVGDSGKNFLRALEMRLDNVVYRAGFATSRAAARQLVNHGHFSVNEVMTDIPSFMVKPGEVIKIKKTSEKNIYFRNSAEKLKKAERPSWLNFSADDLSVKILHEPQDTDLPLNLNIQVITEYYSK